MSKIFLKQISNTYTGIGTWHGGQGKAVWINAGSEGCSQGPVGWC